MVLNFSIIDCSKNRGSVTLMEFNHTWRPEDYHDHSCAQSDAAIQLLQHLRLNGHEQILDVGCGDGKITAKIADLVPRGCVIGIDSSSEMVDYARKSFCADHRINLKFIQQDAREFNYRGSLDVVFSSFSLQWLRNPILFFKNARSSLKPSGCIAITVPLGISVELENSISEVVSLSEWSKYFQTFHPEWYFIEVEKYKEMLIEVGFSLTHLNSLVQSVVFPSIEEFKKYIIPWFSYLNRLPQHLKQFFLEQILDKYLESCPPLGSGAVIFNFPRLDLIADKSFSDPEVRNQ